MVAGAIGIVAPDYAVVVVLCLSFSFKKNKKHTWRERKSSKLLNVQLTGNGTKFKEKESLTVSMAICIVFEKGKKCSKKSNHEDEVKADTESFDRKESKNKNE